jgi:hypothetical protein
MISHIIYWTPYVWSGRKDDYTLQNPVINDVQIYIFSNIAACFLGSMRLIKPFESYISKCRSSK